ncbi:hypothetical protein FNF28_00764 [Cafeteria roenbergensis]|uniref:Fe2OG dioxygenase domain-containing protein n=1 Tax=Cafeteria roenbergensis TaxID=33653 RepID=A0A5A8E3I4_CAFRO|nr:hypothetical protein FNF28_00764 [Cafeteria roenbergensis]
MAAAAHDASEMAGAPVPPPPVVASKAFLTPAAMWERFVKALPEGIRDKSENEQVAYFRRLYASYQQQYSRERAKRDRAVFACIDQYRSYILTHYKPMHPELRELRDGFFDETFLGALRDPSPEAWASIATQVHPGVYTFRLLNEAWCKRLLEEVDHFEMWSKEVSLHVNRPNSMNNYGCVLDDMGFNDVLQRLTIGPIRQLAASLFGAASGAASLDSHHGFIVEYAVPKDRSLGFHVDDSEITVNLCLGTEFEGGDLFFRGERCPQHQQDPCAPEEYFQYKHRPGVAVMHIGRHRHGALPLTAGRRANLILWCRSSAFREAAVRDPALPWLGDLS